MDNLTKAQRKKNMQNIRSKNTLPERLFARELRRHKIYAARHVSTIIGKPDFVFRRKKVVVFIDSDFWHGNKDRGVIPQTNHIYWSKKIQGNKFRDRYVTRILKNSGWRVLRIWEYDLKHDVEKSFNKFLKFIG